ncbi:GNAT family N-acetyltransferase [Cellulosimicrobium cellulans]|uniref:GNAT family N-acetyltransferase n=1 Tax=Cellulosimicrobium cellulans TaxID=1710 RepID=UPI0024051B66|nr:GNAT family protein [Cellulosimicrobium cellulans]MDF9876496.1 RimJ/RimL family protein N-acetyltransferase [Cellulosimicrobium cellulans]
MTGTAPGGVPLYAAGARTRLRGWRADDLAAYRGWLRPEHEWHRWDGPYYPVPDDAASDAAVARLSRAAAAQAARPDGLDDDGLPPRRVVVADEEDRLVGTCSWYWESAETQWARVGIGLYDPAVRGRGLGRDALGAWISYLFSVTDWVRLDLATWSGNAAMLGAARALGLVEEGRSRDARVVDGVRHDAVVLGVLRREWAAGP